MTASSFRDLNLLVQSRQSDFPAIAQHAHPTVYGEASTFWQSVLGERQNFLEADQFNAFRNRTTLATTGVGDVKVQLEDEKVFDQAVMDIVDVQNIPDDVIETLTEPLLGAPFVKPYRGNLFSPTFAHNIAFAWRIKNFVAQFGVSGRPLKVCEIGAGFGGCAVALHQVLDIESYTIIDLPENLYLSSVFLPSSLPERTHRLVNPEEPESFKCEAQLNFSLPSFTDHLDAGGFDLVVNRASLGEMPLATAQAYVAWIGKNLSPDGIFYFHNRFNMPTIEGAKKLSDYGLQNLCVRTFLPMERQVRPAHQIHCEIILSAPPPKAEVKIEHLDAAGDLVAMGFQALVTPILDGIVDDSIDAPVGRALDVIHEVCQVSSLHEKYALLLDPKLDGLPEIKAVLLSAVEIIAGLPAEAVRRKQHVLSYDLGLMLEVRLRGLYAEYERQQGQSWIETVAPLRDKSPSLGAMVERAISKGESPFSYTFKRELRVAS